jgi:transposase
MSEQDQEKKITYEDFKAFHEVHPDLDNTEYYAEFPSVNKSTLRSWKNRSNKETSAPPPQPIAGTPPSTDEEMQKHYIQLLMTQTHSRESEFEGVDVQNKIIILKNKLKNLQARPQRGANSNILASPMPIGQSTKQFGIDPYIDFDLEQNEIRLEIPMSKLMNPVENQKLREIKGV